MFCYLKETHLCSLKTNFSNEKINEMSLWKSKQVLLQKKCYRSSIPTIAVVTWDHVVTWPHDSLYCWCQSKRTDNDLETASGKLLIDLLDSFWTFQLLYIIFFFSSSDIHRFLHGTFFLHSTIVQPITVSESQHTPTEKLIIQHCSTCLSPFSSISRPLKDLPAIGDFQVTKD